VQHLFTSQQLLTRLKGYPDQRREARSKSSFSMNNNRANFILRMAACFDDPIAWTANSYNSSILRKMCFPQQLSPLVYNGMRHPSNQVLKALWHVGRYLRKNLQRPARMRLAPEKPRAKSSTTCGICMDAEIDTVANCGHVYCELCTLSWRRYNQTCPTWRNPISSTWRLYL